MKSLKFFLFTLLFISSALFAQKKNFTFDDVIMNAYRTLLPENISGLQWIPNSNDFCYVDDKKFENTLVKGNEENDNISVIVSLKDLNDALEEENKLRRFPYIKWISAKEFTFQNSKNYYSFNTESNELKLLNRIPEEGENSDTAPNNKYIAYTIDNNLYVSESVGNEKQITFEENKDIVSGQSVHRREFGINKGTFWSPNSNFLAFYKNDQTMVTDYPLVNLQTTPATVENTKYPMAGQTSEEVTLGIYNMNSGETIYLETGDPTDQYLCSVTWGPDEKFFYIAHLNRDQNHLTLKKYDALTGKFIKDLFEEQDEQWVEPENPLYFAPGSNNRFIWFSERDGWNHLYLYDTDGNLIKKLTSGKWVVTSLNGFSKDGSKILITTTKEDPRERHTYTVEIESGDMKQITVGKGTHNVSGNDSYEYFLDSYTAQEIPRQINIFNKNGDLTRNILTADNPLEQYNIGETKYLSLQADDGTELYCRMILPPDFDESKKYPVVVYVYGGPHAQLVIDSFPAGRYNIWFHMMAQNGFIIFTLDNRGSANRGLEFEQAIHRQLGTVEVADQLKGVEYLKSLSYVDGNRIGVYGWSYGGFMTTSLMTRTDGAFKVGACGGAVIDWKYYEVMYTERYMDTPQSNPDGFEQASLLKHAENLKGNLLLVHGTKDPTVVWQNTLKFAQICSNLNIPLDYFPYIGHGHGVGGKDALHLYEKITKYFIDNL